MILLASAIASDAAWGRGRETEAYFGELHLHTSLSTDAFMNGTRKHPVTAYRFAQGDPVVLTSGETWSLETPLDFVAVTDHSESFGDLPLCTTPGSPVYALPVCQAMRGNDPTTMGRVIGGWSVEQAKRNPEICGDDGARCLEAERSTWQLVRDAANRANRPGEFTALVGYEYSPVILGAGQTTKVHRNVIFRSDDVPDRAFSSYDGTIEDLHAWLDRSCAPPCRAITIPHNSNASSSRIFWEGKNSDGTPWSQEILERRARLEPLVEIYQGKGSSECHPGLGLTDEECGFEQWVRNCGPGEQLGCATTSDMVRDTIVRGLRIEAERGVNPHKLGFIGSTDSHLGTPGATVEDDYQGQLGHPDSTPERRLAGGFALPGQPKPADGGWGFMGSTKFSPGGLAAVWAEENTRDAIWDALARREAFSTSGTRLRVRFFGGFELPADVHARRDAIAQGYRKGVPMGGDLVASNKGGAPRFFVWAARDPASAPLQKIQIVKGWIEDGEERARVVDVVCADGAVPDGASGRCPEIAGGVDLETCAVDESRGDAELATTWTDPDFDAAKRAVYYARVLEQPVCRWSTHDARRIGAALPEHVPATIEERAWTSPIWYTPAP
ncbi:MAG: DUF3604 domain-containing protein [Myxococcota bacterium]|nr:DUF3604 domain-containing protein [Myxococcales bacterium]